MTDDPEVVRDFVRAVFNQPAATDTEGNDGVPPVASGSDPDTRMREFVRHLFDPANTD